MKIQEVRSLDLPELEPYRTLRRPHEHIKQGIFVAEGEKVVRRLLESGLAVLSVLLTPHWLEEFRKKYSLEGTEIFVAEKKLLESIVGYPLHQGVMAIGKVPDEPALEELLSNVSHPVLFVALDGIVSAENVGVIVRNCAAFGVQAIFADSTSSSPYLRRAVRNSMGTIFKLPVFHVKLTDVLRRLRCKVIATSPNAKLSVEDIDFQSDLCVVFGNEGNGVSEAVLRLCDAVVSIPMLNQTDSLNVGSASAVFLYEVRRQGRACPR